MCSFQEKKCLFIAHTWKCPYASNCKWKYFSHNWSFLVVGLLVESCCDDSEEKIVND